ncbi:hypothetical protein AB0B15_29885, partial [Streptomyces sp. NPDC045456]
MVSTSHSDKVASYEERRPDEPDELDERGRSAAAASTAGAVISSMVVTTEWPLCCLPADGTYARGRTADGLGVGAGRGDVGLLDGGGAAADLLGVGRGGGSVLAGAAGAAGAAEAGGR